MPLVRNLFFLFSISAALSADEGMWTFDNVPIKKMSGKYGFAPGEAWLRNLQGATLRFPGGTGAFVSSEGLVITNHHVGRGFIAQVSTVKADLVRDGFTAAARDQELRIPGLELMMLVSQENVTAQVKAAVLPGMPEKQALSARQEVFSRLRKAEEAKSGLTCEPVTLYQGGEFWLYRYRKFTDVRLVAAPELQLAGFGGDFDNYTYPRWNLDFALFRVYEDNQAFRPDHYLPFSAKPLSAGDLTLISGHPGTTFRQQTLAQMLHARDTFLPFSLKSMAFRKRALQAFADTNREAARMAAGPIDSIGNSTKRFSGQLLGLHKPENLKKVKEAEAALKLAVAKDPELKARTARSWAAIEKAVLRQKSLLLESHLINTAGSDLLGKALVLVRMPQEAGKPSERRLPEFMDGNLQSTRTRLLNPRPVEKPLDTTRLAAGLREAQLELGAGHPFVRAMLAGKSPEAVAQAAIDGTQIHEPAFRKQLLEGGKAAMDACGDPLIELARKLDPFHRAIRKKVEEGVTSVLNEHGGRIAEARFKIHGKESYPDATFTLRLSYGPVATYATGSGTKAQPFTTFMGLFDRHQGWGGNAAAAEDGAWTLPSRWLARKERLDLNVPFNFIYNCDTVGGNSGSPVVNRAGEFVGINFDSVYEGQGGYYVYDAETKRAVAVDARAILESLGKIMDGEHLVKELMAK